MTEIAWSVMKHIMESAPLLHLLPSQSFYDLTLLAPPLSHLLPTSHLPISHLLWEITPWKCNREGAQRSAEFIFLSVRKRQLSLPQEWSHYKLVNNTQ